MAFLSKKVPKIFPSSKKGATSTTDCHGNTNPSHKARGGGSLFRKQHPHSPESSLKAKLGSPEDGSSLRKSSSSRSRLFKGSRKVTGSPSPRSTTALQVEVVPTITPATSTGKTTNNLDNLNIDAKGETLLLSSEEFENVDGCECEHDYPYENNCAIHCETHSEAATIESSPTPTPRETMDVAVLSLPDLPKLAFPSSQAAGSGNNSNNSNSNVNSTPPPPTTPNNNFNTSHNHNTSPPRLLPRPRTLDSPPQQQQQQQQTANNNHCNLDCNQNGDHDSENEQHPTLPPPVALVSFPNCPELVLPPPSPVSKTRGCLSGPPPRATDWDDATIESSCNGNGNEDCKEHEHPHPHPTAATTAHKHETAARAAATMKPWIERAARLALLQNKACCLDRNQQQSLQQSQQYESSATTTVGLQPRLSLAMKQRREKGQQQHLHQRALLAALEREERSQLLRSRDPFVVGAEQPRSSQSPRQQSQQQLQQQGEQVQVQSPRIVKWHVVRHPS